MKKLITAALAAMMLFTITGCSSKQDPQDTIKTIEENGFHVLFYLGTGDYYDAQGNAYSEEGIQKDKSRLTGAPTDIITYLIVKGDQTLTAYTSKDDDNKLYSLYYPVDEGSYSVSLKEKKRSAFISGVSSNTDSCYHYFEGKAEKDSAFETCSSNKLKEAEKIETQYNDFLEKLDVSEEELIAGLNWLTTTSVKDVKKDLTKEFKNQKPLTNDEIISAFKKQDYDIAKGDDGVILISNVNTVSDFRIRYITSLLNDNHEPYALLYVYNLYYKPSSSQDVGISYGYYFDNEREVTLSTDSKYMYDLTNEKSIGDLTCDADFVETSGTLQFTFHDLLQTVGVTKDELVSFLKTY